MATSSFQLFPLLPCELRLEVWKMAIRPAGAGVHRISLRDSSSSSSSPSVSGNTLRAVPAGDKQESRRRHIAVAEPEASGSSASLWDAGLWTACSESRQVMMWHFRLQFWQDAGRNLLRAGGYWSPAAVADEFEDMTAMAIAWNGQADRYIVVQPHRDLFWLEPQDWKTTVDWRTLFVDLPFSSSLRGYGHLSHIAVEFDQSWNVHLPKDLPALLKESSPRGFIARAMAECATNRLYSFIWLVDRHLVRDAPVQEEAMEIDTEEEAEETDQPMTFYDCRDVYVETEREDLELSRYSTQAEYEKTAVYFLQRLGTIGNGDYALMGNDSGEPDGFEFTVDDYLGVLALV
ncbi:hypothetical protein CDD80_3500 [Ophiocordyceps camponoti-rufipedis]|uniref:2EXR domain-containing protein n=1 Tax=Ophiocordyceps camponoti-rufipedis TaxID=2004952 RepID=A0A2C5ZJ78_9HYPO|nr:hypothetical protein CDD80_3500 [Ophiocordyceps camponoti-rufipedis]